MIRISACRFTLTFLCASACAMAVPAAAQFGDLMKELQKQVEKLQPPPSQQKGTRPPSNKGQQPAPQRNSANPSANQGGSTLPPAIGKPSSALIPSAQWCREQAGTLKDIKIDTSVTTSEFSIRNLESLQDEFLAAFRRARISKTFPHATFFQNSFETKRVRSIYDVFIAFPEPDTLAALIQLSRGADPQERVDATMALVFLHLQAPHLSINKDRWWELLHSVMNTQHWTVMVFRARMSAYGEIGSKDLAVALGHLVDAGQLRASYRDASHGKEFDTQNLEVAHSATAKDIYYNEPKMPYRQQWQGVADLARQAEIAQAQFATMLPNSRIGKLYAEANRLNGSALNIGNEIIKLSQSGNQFAGQLASLQSLKSSAYGDKPVFEDINPELQAAQIRMISQGGNLDSKQKQLLTEAQQQRLLSQGLVAQSFADLLQISMNYMSSGDMIKMVAPLPALTQANNLLIQSCMVSAKWDQAMRAKDVPPPDKSKAAAGLAEKAKQYSDS